MPELPDVTVYVEALERQVLGRKLLRVRLLNPFLLRTAVPPIGDVEGRRVEAIRRVGKRIVWVLEGGLFLVLHLMIAGRLHWEGRKGRTTLAIFEFESGALTLTEAGSKRRASLHVLNSLEGLDPGGIEVMDSHLAAFSARDFGDDERARFSRWSADRFATEASIPRLAALYRGL